MRGFALSMLTLALAVTTCCVQISAHYRQQDRLRDWNSAYLQQIEINRELRGKLARARIENRMLREPGFFNFGPVEAPSHRA